MAREISLMIVGAGDRGRLYAELASRDPRVRIVAVADPDELRRTTLAERHAVPSTRRYSDWREVIEQPRIADAAVIATLDRLHHELEDARGHSARRAVWQPNRNWQAKADW